MSRVRAPDHPPKETATRCNDKGCGFLISQNNKKASFDCSKDNNIKNINLLEESNKKNIPKALSNDQKNKNVLDSLSEVKKFNSFK